MIETPKYSQAVILSVTGADAGSIQNWVNPKRASHLVLAEPYPGKGRPRLYSAIDVVKIAILKRFADFGINIGAGIRLAEEVGRELKRHGEIEWNVQIPLYPSALALHEAATVISSPPFYGWGADNRDARQIPVGEYIESNRELKSRRVDGDGKILPNIRDELASKGIHAEPVLIFPLGEIVNGTLLQLETDN